MLRAGPFSDARIVGLINRRFVPVVFDLLGGALEDAEAKRFVVRRKKRLAGRVVSNEPLLVMSPEGEVLAETLRYAETKHILRKLERVLRVHPEYDHPTAAEKNASSLLARARIRLDLRDIEGARRILTDVKDPEQNDRAQLMLASLARDERDWKTMEAHLQKVESGAYSSEVRMERAYPPWYGEDYEKLAAHLKDFPANSPRYTEARYYEGLAYFHLGEKKQARKIWKATIRSKPQDPWIYRADWAYWSSKQKQPAGFTIIGGGVGTPLGRISYLIWTNPELEGPQRR